MPTDEIPVVIETEQAMGKFVFFRPGKIRRSKINGEKILPPRQIHVLQLFYSQRVRNVFVKNSESREQNFFIRFFIQQPVGLKRNVAKVGACKPFA